MLLTVLELEEEPGALLLVPSGVRLVDEKTSDEWRIVRDQALAEIHQPVEMLFDLSSFEIEPNAIGFWGPSEREFLARKVKQIVRFGFPPLPITTTLIEVAGRRYGFPANLANNRVRAVAMLRSLRG